MAYNLDAKLYRQLVMAENVGEIIEDLEEGIVVEEIEYEAREEIEYDAG